MNDLIRRIAMLTMIIGLTSGAGPRLTSPPHLSSGGCRPTRSRLGSTSIDTPRTRSGSKWRSTRRSHAPPKAARPLPN